MVVIELTYIESLEQVERYLEAHRQFLDAYYQKGVFIASGAKVPREGGIIIANGDREAAQAYIQNDPFYQNKIARYDIVEFMASKYAPGFQHLMLKD